MRHAAYAQGLHQQPLRQHLRGKAQSGTVQPNARHQIEGALSRRSGHNGAWHHRGHHVRLHSLREHFRAQPSPGRTEGMQTKRVVITGMGSISPFGRGVDTLVESLFNMKSAVVHVPALADLGGLKTRVAALVTDIDPKEIPRKHRRSMSMMSIFATLACQEALNQGNPPEEYFSNGRMGIVIGSTVGSPIATQGFF